MGNIITALMIVVTALSLLLTPIEIEARGGRGGGGRGGGGRSGGAARTAGSYRGGHTMNRTPSMSRASSRPAASQTRQRSQSVSQSRGQRSWQGVEQRPSAANRSELRNQVNLYSQSRAAQNVDRQARGERAQNFSNNRTSQIAQNRELSDRVSQRLQRTEPNFNRWFDRNFFDRHNIDRDYVGTGANWWRPAAWATLASWGAWSWSTPYYYDEGYAYPLTSTEPLYSDSSYSSTTSSVQTQPEQNIQTNAATDADWLPLGVFAVSNNSSTAVYAHRFLQLAINRKGEIAGVLYNSTTDTAQDLTGMVDPASQKAYWSLANQVDSPIASTGIYNLTTDKTPITVHFPDGMDQTWTLVRLQQE